MTEHFALGHLCSISSGRWLPAEELTQIGTPVFGANGIIGHTSRAPNVPHPAVLLGRVGSIGAINLVTEPVYATDNALICAPGPNMDANFLSFALAVANLSSLRSASIQPLITARAIRSVLIPRPNLEDQRRIAAQLAKERDTIDAARTAAEIRRTRVDDLRIRILREFIPLPPQGPWPWVRLDAAAEFLDSRRRPISSSERASRIRGLDPTKLVPYFGANGQAGWIDAYLFDEPLVLLAEDGGAFGSSRTPIAYRIDGKTWVNNHAHVLRPRPGVDVDFLGFALAIRPDIGDVISGSTRGKLNRSVAGDIQVPLPPLVAQSRIAAELRERLAIIDAVESAIRAEREAIDALPASLLHRAFDGLAA